MRSSNRCRRSIHGLRFLRRGQSRADADRFGASSRHGARAARSRAARRARSRSPGGIASRLSVVADCRAVGDHDPRDGRRGARRRCARLRFQDGELRGADRRRAHRARRRTRHHRRHRARRSTRTGDSPRTDSVSRSGNRKCSSFSCRGKPNKLICRDLKLSEGTVKVHVSAILKALNVHSRSQAIVELARRGVTVDPLAERR